MNNIPQTIFPDDKIFEEIPYVYCYSGEEAKRIIQNMKEHFKDKVEVEIVVNTEYYEFYTDNFGRKHFVHCDGVRRRFFRLDDGSLTSSILCGITYYKFEAFMKEINSKFTGEFVYDESKFELSLSIDDISGYNDIFYFAVDFIDYFKQIEPKFRNITLKCTNGE